MFLWERYLCRDADPKPQPQTQGGGNTTILSATVALTAVYFAFALQIALEFRIPTQVPAWMSRQSLFWRANRPDPTLNLRDSNPEPPTRAQGGGSTILSETVTAVAVTFPSSLRP